MWPACVAQFAILAAQPTPARERSALVGSDEEKVYIGKRRRVIGVPDRTGLVGCCEVQACGELVRDELRASAFSASGSVRARGALAWGTHRSGIVC